MAGCRDGYPLVVRGGQLPESVKGQQQQLVDATATVQIVIAIACAIAALLVLVHKLDVDRSLVLGRAQVLPEVERMFVEGRYAYAAQPEPAAR